MNTKIQQSRTGQREFVASNLKSLQDELQAMLDEGLQIRSIHNLAGIPQSFDLIVQYERPNRRRYTKVDAVGRITCNPTDGFPMMFVEAEPVSNDGSVTYTCFHSFPINRRDWIHVRLKGVRPDPRDSL